FQDGDALDATAPRQIDVHQDDVRRELRYAADGLDAVPENSDALDVLLPGEQLDECLVRGAMVLHHADPDHMGRFGFLVFSTHDSDSFPGFRRLSGSLSSTRTPPSSGALNSNVPPINAI